MRGHITGVTDTSLWGMYSAGARADVRLPRSRTGWRKNTPLPTHIVTPTTKAEHGGHDEPLSCDDVVERGLLPAELWERVDGGRVGDLRPRRVELGRAGRTDPRRHQVRVRADARRRADPDRRGAHARLVALVGRRHATTPGSPPGSSPRASTRRSSGGRSPTSATRATGRCRRCPTRSGPRPRPATSTPTSGSPTSAFEPGAYPVADRLIANLTKAGLL